MEKTEQDKREATKMTTCEEAEAILDAIVHSANYCPLCWKKVGVCRHTVNIQRGAEIERG
jgi:hypothetical protein